MSSIFPPWVTDLSSVSSIVGFGITVLLLWEARAIRNSFVRKARLPEVIKDLNSANKAILQSLQNWDADQKEGVRQFKIAKVLLENLKPKLPDSQKKKITIYSKKFERRKWLFFCSNLTTATIDEAWDLYSELSTSITSLVQLQKDSKWD